MSWMHAKAVTKDATDEDTAWRERCERKFMVRADPSERERIPAGYWAQCYAYWNARDPQGHFENMHWRGLAVWWRDVCYRVEYVAKRHLGVGL